MKWIYVTIIALILISCEDKNPIKESQSAQDSPHFFDLKGFMNKEIQYLESNNCSSFKKARINDRYEEQTVDSILWKKELGMIADADINKNAWIPHFQTDTLITNQLTKVSYKALKSNIPIQLLEIVSNEDGIVTDIYIIRKSSNYIFSSEQKIRYSPRKSYEANGSQKALFMRNQTFSIQSTFNCPL